MSWNGSYLIILVPTGRNILEHYFHWKNHDINQNKIKFSPTSKYENRCHEKKSINKNTKLQAKLKKGGSP